MIEFLKELLKKYQTVLIPLVALVIGIVLLIFVVVPQAVKIPDTNNQITESKDSYQHLSQKLSIVQAVNKDEYQKQIATALTAMPADKDVANAFNQVATLMADNGLQLTDVGVSNPSATTGIPGTYNISMEMSGTAGGLSTFISKLVDLSRIIRITGFDVSLSQLAGGQLLSRINLLTFYQPIPNTLGAVDQPLSPPSPTEKEMLDKIAAKASSGTSIAPSGAVGKDDPFQ